MGGRYLTGTCISYCRHSRLAKRKANTDILQSLSHLVLLGHDWNGLSTFQRISSPISQKLGANCANAHQYCLSQLRHHVASGRTWIRGRLLHGRYQVYRPQVYDRDVQSVDGHPYLSLHGLFRPQLSAGNDVFGGLCPEHYVWSSIRLVRSSLPFSPAFSFILEISIYHLWGSGDGYGAKYFRSPRTVLPKCFRLQTEGPAPASRRV